ncbi:hypothetical protein VUR80DRAFT_4614 [Thermomyces stellatus]
MQGAPLWRKCMVVFTTSWVTLSACFSSTLFFSTVDEIAEEFNVSKVTVNVANAGVLLTLGMSTLVWGPVEVIFGRRVTYNFCIIVLLALTVIAGVVRNIEAFIVARILSGFQGTYFHVAAQTIFAEYFPPTQRGTATGFFLAGVVLGSPSGPLVAAVVVTFKDWRVILWIQAAMVSFGLVLSMLFIRFGQAKPDACERSRSVRETLRTCSPMRVLESMKYPKVLATVTIRSPNVACGFLSWPQFFLLAAPRHIIGTRFQLNTSILAGLFYLSLACGFLVGTIVGGWSSDKTVKRWISRRGGVRVPEDRLRSGMISFFILIPAAYLGFGWGMECDPCSRARLAVPIVTAFIASAGIFDAMTGLNTYCSEVVPPRRRDIIASKYLVQYTFSATASAVAVLLMDAMGLGPACTLNAGLVLISAVITVTTSRCATTVRHSELGQAEGDSGFVRSWLPTGWFRESLRHKASA